MSRFECGHYTRKVACSPCFEDLKAQVEALTKERDELREALAGALSTWTGQGYNCPECCGDKEGRVETPMQVQCIREDCYNAKRRRVLHGTRA